MIDTHPPRVVTAVEDDRLHTPVQMTSGTRTGPKHTTLTACGRHPASHPCDLTGSDRACGICLPGHAHPLDVVWQQCERWDANANADIPIYQYALED